MAAINRQHVGGTALASMASPLGALNGGARPANPWADAAPTGTPVHPAKRPKLASLFSKVLGVTLAALLVLPIAEATQPAEAGKKFKTITKTFASNGQVDIPDAGTQGPANPFPTTIDVDGFKKFKKAKITDVNLTLRDFSHQRSENVDVMLALGNRRAIVMGDAGNATDVNNLDITLDDQAGADLQNGVVLAGGTFRPTNLLADADLFPAPAPATNENVALSSFDGLKPDGQWRLFVHDDFNGDTGSLDAGWELEITAKVKNEKDKKGKGKNKKND